MKVLSEQQGCDWHAGVGLIFQVTLPELVNGSALLWLYADRFSCSLLRVPPPLETTTHHHAECMCLLGFCCIKPLQLMEKKGHVEGTKDSFHGKSNNVVCWPLICSIHLCLQIGLKCIYCKLMLFICMFCLQTPKKWRIFPAVCNLRYILNSCEAKVNSQLLELQITFPFVI